jgi:hypothetical protein
MCRIVGEERLQGVACGSTDNPPALVLDWQANGRDASFLEPFAGALDDYVSSALAAGRLPRVWISDDIAFGCLELLARRYHRNAGATELIQRLGWICEAYTQEAAYPGQQAIVLAVDLLRQHVITGHSAIDDLHLEAMLTWLDPPSGVDLGEEAARRALVPLASMLTRAADERVERLRTLARKGRGTLDEIRSEIEGILRDAVLREWDILMSARDAYWRLGLEPDKNISKLADASRRRLTGALLKPQSRPNQSHSLAQRLADQELAQQIIENLDICGDPLVRERARTSGRVILAKVTRVEQPKPSRRPCRLVLLANQTAMRVRVGTLLQSIDRTLQGRVVSIREAGQEDTVLELEIEKGFRVAPRLQVGDFIDWTTAVVVDMVAVRAKSYAAMQQASSPLVYPRSAPRSEVPRVALSAGELVTLAEQVRNLTLGGGQEP